MLGITITTLVTIKVFDVFTRREKINSIFLISKKLQDHFSENTRTTRVHQNTKEMLDLLSELISEKLEGDWKTLKNCKWQFVSAN